MINTLRLSALALAVAVLSIVPSTARAAPITGGVSFGGVWQPTGGANNTDIAGATGVDILGTSTVLCSLVPNCSGAYAAVNAPTFATYNDFTFAPLGGNINPLWSFTFGPNTYTFKLETVSIVNQNAQFLTLSGTGTLTATGFDNTQGEWTFSGDSAGATIAFSSTSNAVRQVPEPAMLAMLGLGLVVGASRFRRRPTS